MWAFFKVSFLPARSPGPDISSNSRCDILSRPRYTEPGTHCMYLGKSPHGHHGGPPLLPSSDFKGANSERGTSQKDGWPCNRMSMRTVPSKVRRRPLYLSVRVFPKPSPGVGHLASHMKLTSTCGATATAVGLLSKWAFFKCTQTGTAYCAGGRMCTLHIGRLPVGRPP